MSNLTSALNEAFDNLSNYTLKENMSPKSMLSFAKKLVDNGCGLDTLLGEEASDIMYELYEELEDELEDEEVADKWEENIDEIQRHLWYKYPNENWSYKGGKDCDPPAKAEVKDFDPDGYGYEKAASDIPGLLEVLGD